MVHAAGMSNVLTEQQPHDIRALGRLGWSLRQIERQTGIRRETISDYLKAAGIPVRARGGRPRVWPPAKPATTAEVSTDSVAKPATSAEVSTDSAPSAAPLRAPSASACAPYRDLIADALVLGRNAVAIYQDLVDGHGFTAKYPSVRRFEAPRCHAGGRAGRDRDDPRCREPSRLWRRTDGPLCGHGKISPDPAVSADAGALTQSRAAADVALERADLV